RQHRVDIGQKTLQLVVPGRAEPLQPRKRAVVKVRQPLAPHVPKTEADPELFLVAPGEHHDAPVFLAQLVVDRQARHPREKRGEPLRTADSENAVLIGKRHKLGRIPECDVSTHLRDNRYLLSPARICRMAPKWYAVCAAVESAAEAPMASHSVRLAT